MCVLEQFAWLLTAVNLLSVPSVTVETAAVAVEPADVTVKTADVTVESVQLLLPACSLLLAGQYSLYSPGGKCRELESLCACQLGISLIWGQVE